jgi:hypothetical protein
MGPRDYRGGAIPTPARGPAVLLGTPATRIASRYEEGTSCHSGRVRCRVGARTRRHRDSELCSAATANLMEEKGF